MSSDIDLHTHAGSAFDNLDLLTPSLMHDEVLPWNICTKSLVLIAQAVFLLERGNTCTDPQTRKAAYATITLYTRASATAAEISSNLSVRIIVAVC